MRRLRVREKLALWFALVALLSVSLVAWLTYTRAARRLTEEFGGKLMAVAASAGAAIDGERFATLRDAGQMSSAAYREIQRSLQQIRGANSHIRFRYLYTMAPTEKPGEWRYVVDSEPASSGEFSALGDTEDFGAGDVVVDAHRFNRPVADRHIKDYPGWGPLLTVAAPIRDAQGRAIGIVGVDAPATSLQELRQGLLLVCTGALGGGLLLAVLLGSGVSWGITRPLDRLVAATEAIGQGDLEHQVKLPPGDEFGRLGDSFNSMTQGLRQRDLYKQQFQRYVSRQIAEKILKEPEKDFWHGERRRVTVLFSDIRGFTSVAETLPPEQVTSLLNEYLRVMVEIVFKHGGTLDKFIGDAVMAVFGAPVSLGDDEIRAVRAAVEMRRAVDQLCVRWAKEGKPALHIGIGINTGEVIVGNIGSKDRLEYAAIGDHVNVAARLEALNKEYETTILMSESTFRAVARFVESRKVGPAAVRGRSQPVEVYELVDLRDEFATMLPGGKLKRAASEAGEEPA